MINLISAHIPKTAGTSLNDALKIYYNNGYVKDYNQHLNHQDSKEFSNSIDIEDYKNIKCIHGHFYPIKYEKLKEYNWKFITFLRDPIDRLISNYFQIKRNANDLKEDHFAIKVIRDNFSIEDYCLSPNVKDVYKNYFLYFEDKYDFVGITENYKKDLNYLSNKYFNRKLKYCVTNINPNKNYYNSYNIDSNLRKKIEIFHEADITIYRKYLKLSNERNNDFIY